MKYWWNDYVGLPYKLHGRDKNGLDCWGLVRLVYKEQKLIELPSLHDQYTSAEEHVAAEAIALNSEGWEKVDTPQEGDVVLFRIGGQAAHVGVVLADSKKFIHAREGKDVAIESLDAPAWKRRLVGAYVYNSAVTVNAVPSALNTLRVHLTVAAGQTVEEIVAGIAKQSIEGHVVNHIVFIDGVPVDQTKWATTVLKPGQILDYRVVPAGGGGSIIRTLAFVALAVAAAAVLGPLLAGVAPGALAAGGATASSAVAGASFMGLSGATALYAATAVVNVVGGMLLNAIFPIRPPEMNGPDTPKRIHQLQGGANNANRYGAIPVVLGRMRFTPPLGGTTYVENDGDTSYLRMLLIWGYGPLQITDVRIGNNPLSNLEEVDIITLDGEGDTEDDTKEFNSIYGKDVVQLAPGTQLEAQKQYISKFQITHEMLDIGQPNPVSRPVFTVTVDKQGEDKQHNLQIGDPVALSYTKDDSVGGAILTVVQAVFTQSTTDLSKYAVTNLKVISTPSNYTFKATPVNTSIDYADVSEIEIGYTKNFWFYGGNPWQEFTLDSQDFTKVSITLNYPQGLYGISDKTGKDLERESKVSIQLKMFGDSDWNEAFETVAAGSTKLGTAYYNIDSDAEVEPVYRLTRAFVRQNGTIRFASGQITNTKGANPSGTLKTRLQNESGFLSTELSYIPTTESGEQLIYSYWVYGDKVVEVIDHRPSTVTGCASTPAPGVNLSVAERSVKVAAGKITRLEENSKEFDLGNSTFRISGVYKEPFAKTISFNLKQAGKCYIRVRKTSFNTHFTNTTVDQVQLQYITGYSPTPPIYLPKNSYNQAVTLARSAIKIRATNQLNNSLEGVTGTVSTLGEDLIYSGSNYASGIWTPGKVIRNPAALFRYVLQHSGNAKANVIQLDDTTIRDWYHFCKTEKFTFDTVIMEPKSLLDILRDICAAGRASPTMVDGKWSVVIDRPKTYIAQHFTPHNSWGFEGTRLFPQIPHGFRVNFSNADKAFRVDEKIVYADGYTASNATLFESIELPGITSADLVHRHARFHLAQIQLRPETYILNTDIEHLVCTRGDLVKVVHDVPMWGLGSGRITGVDVPDVGDPSTQGVRITLDESLPMVAGKVYGIRIRTEKGASVTLKVKPAAEDGYYNILELRNEDNTPLRTASVSGNGISDSLREYDLVLYGEYEQESINLLVQQIEPASNMTARLTLVDYSPAIYSSDTELIPPFTSQITSPPILQEDTVESKPVIDSTKIKSDHTVMELLAPKTYRYKMVVPIKPLTTSIATKEKITHIEGQVRKKPDSVYDTITMATEWSHTTIIPIESKAITFTNVVEGQEYDIRVRYVGKSGLNGPWSAAGTDSSPYTRHTVVGRTANPSTPTGLAATMVATELRLDWSDIPDIDVAGYEVRTSDANWGDNTDIANRKYKGVDSKCVINNVPEDINVTYYVKAYDVLGKYSTTPAQVSFKLDSPPNVTGLLVERVGTKLKITPSYSGTLPDNFMYYEIRVIQGVGTDDFWTSPGTIATTIKSGSALVDLIGFSSPRISTSGITYRVACRIVNTSYVTSIASKLGSKILRTI